MSVFLSMIPDIVHFWSWTILMDELETAQIQYPIIYDEPEVYGRHYTEFLINPEKTLCIYYDH